MYIIQVHPLVIEELTEAKHFYDSKVQDLGNLFLDEVEKAIDLIKESPGIRRKITTTSYCYILLKFPFKIIYRIKNDTIEIIAIMHQHRKPLYWHRRII